MTEVESSSYPPVEFDGHSYEVVSSLASWIERLGGYNGVLPVPAGGDTYSISLEAWRGRDPDHTMLLVVLSDDDAEDE